MKKTILYCFISAALFSCKSKTETEQPDVFAADLVN